MKTPDEVKELVKFEFEKYDKNQNGYLEIDEVRMLMDDTCTELGQDLMTDEQLEKVFKSLDANKDGKLSFEELFRLVGPLLAH